MLLRSGRKLKSLTMDDLNVTDLVGTDSSPPEDLFNDLTLNDGANDGVP